MKWILMIAAAAALSACTNADPENKGMSLEQALAESPSGEVCVFGDIEVVCLPTNRGKNGKCKETEIDNRTFEPAYYRGDVDFNGTIADRADSQLATKRIYVKQIESTPCPAAADISQHEGEARFEPDTWLTSNDINLWRYVHRTGDFPLRGELICQSQCAVINHMDPSVKN